jgi:nucleoside-diphosphate-sugar epimerase
VCVRDLASLIIQVTGGKAEIVYNVRTDPGVSRVCADISLARSKLSYQPTFSLAEGLKLTIDRDLRFRKDATRPLQPPPSNQ